MAAGELLRKIYHNLPDSTQQSIRENVLRPLRKVMAQSSTDVYPHLAAVEILSRLPILVQVRSWDEYYSIKACGCKEVDHLKSVCTILQHEMTLTRDDLVVFDVGAHLGIHTLNYASLSQKINVHAFEPNPQMVRLLRTNVTANELRKVIIINSALSNEEGERLLITSPGSEGTGSLREGVRGEHTIPVSTMQAYNYMSEKDVYPVVVKIDVEGWAVEVLEGFKLDLLRQDQKPKHFFIEVHPYENWTRIQDILIETGYKIVYIKKRGEDLHVHFELS